MEEIFPSNLDGLDLTALKALQERNANVRDIAKALEVEEATLYRFQKKAKAEGKIIWKS